jgi:hypothetical protein
MHADGADLRRKHDMTIEGFREIMDELKKNGIAGLDD